MTRPRVVPLRVRRRPRRQLADKLQELSLRSPKDLHSLEPLVDYALARLDPPRPVRRRLT